MIPKKTQDEKPPGEEKELTPEEIAQKAAAAKGEEEEVDLDDPNSIPEAMRPLITKLRKENQTLRTKNKETISKFDELNGKFSKMEKSLKKVAGVEEDTEVDAEKLTSDLQTEKNNNQALQFRASVLEIALENGISNRDGVDYLEYLIGKAGQELTDGEELSEELIAGIVKKAKTQFGTKSSSTSVGKDETPPPGDVGKTTVEQFSKMTMTEKQLLYNKDSKLYETLFATAKEKRILL